MPSCGLDWDGRISTISLPIRGGRRGVSGGAKKFRRQAEDAVCELGDKKMSRLGCSEAWGAHI